MIKNIIFDLGNVVVKWDANRVYHKHFNSAKLSEEFYATTKIKELNIEFDRGLPFDTGLHELASQHPHYSEAIWLWKNRWSDMLGGEIDGTLAIISELKAKGYKLYALTNWADETFVYAEENFTWLSEFIDIVVSGRENLVKPDPAIFELLLKRNNLVANECVFIDDTLVNVAAADKLGMHALHFVSPEKLSMDLKQLQVL
jgi:2-haloacid dehalogenase